MLTKYKISVKIKYKSKARGHKMKIRADFDFKEEAMGIKVLPTSLWEAYHSLEEDPLILNALGPHVSEKFLELKYQEWDEYRVQVFGYEQRKYLDI